MKRFIFCVFAELAAMGGLVAVATFASGIDDLARLAVLGLVFVLGLANIARSIALISVL